MRVASLLPSATELVYALGLEPVAVSHECDYPPGAAAKPAVNDARIDAEATTAEINEQVVAAERGDGVYEIDLAALERADPDLIVTQGVCDVCAVDRVLVEEAVEETGLDARILTLDPHHLEDVFDDLRRLGAATGREDRGESVVEELRARVRDVERRATAAGERPRVVVFDWTDPVMVAGHWVPELVERAGGEYGMCAPGARARPRQWSEVRSYDPEVLVAAPCGFGLAQTRENVGDLTGRDGWSSLTAVSSGRAYLLDGHHYVNRPGPRLVDTLEHLAKLIHPELFGRPPRDVAAPIAERAAEP